MCRSGNARALIAEEAQPQTTEGTSPDTAVANHYQFNLASYPLVNPPQTNPEAASASEFLALVRSFPGLGGGA